MNKCQKCGTSWIAQVMACPECGKDMSEAAVPDDPVAVLLSLMPKQDVGVLRFPEWHEAIRALAAHYLHKAPEGYALVPRATLEHWREYWNGNRNDRAMWDALNHILDEVETILADAAMQAGRKP